MGRDRGREGGSAHLECISQPGLFVKLCLSLLEKPARLRSRRPECLMRLMIQPPPLRMISFVLRQSPRDYGARVGYAMRTTGDNRGRGGRDAPSHPWYRGRACSRH